MREFMKGASSSLLGHIAGIGLIGVVLMWYTISRPLLDSRRRKQWRTYSVKGARRPDRARKDYIVSRFLFSSNAFIAARTATPISAPHEKECDNAKSMAIPVRTKRRPY